MPVLTVEPESSVSDTVAEEPDLTEVEEKAVHCLLRHGVLPARARQLVKAHGFQRVTEVVEYIGSQLQGGTRKTIENPAGLIVHSLENNLPLPVVFTTTRRREKMKEAEHALALAHASEGGKCKGSRAIAAIHADSGPIDVLVNNAGVERTGPVEDLPLTEVRAVLETNYFGDPLIR